MGNIEHTIQLNDQQRRELIKFLEAPNGSFDADKDGRVTVEAVMGGGVLVRTMPYRHGGW